MTRRWSLLPLVLVMTTAGCGYNRIQELDEQTNQTRSNIDTELMRRNDLIPNLVATVDQAAKFEQQTHTRIAEARSGLQQARERMDQAVKSNATTAELSQANNALSEQLRGYINVSVEAYPDLKSNANFRALQDELTETENRIAVSRRDYNESVNAYNTYIRRFPANLTAKVVGADRKTPFEAPPGTQEAPKVQFPTTTG